MTEVFTAGVITICTDPRVAEQFVQAVERKPWLIVTANFEGYVSSQRRPYISPELKAANACVALVDFDHDPDQAMESIKFLRQTFPRIMVVALAADRAPELLLMAMRAGCNEFLPKPFHAAAVADTLDQMEGLFAVPEVLDEPKGTVISFFGAKGGVGTTTLAVHLAMYLVQCQGKKTLLIDTHDELGHVCVYLGLDGTRYHFHEVVRNVDRLDSELLRGYVARHASGLEVLSSPDVCGGGRPIDADSVRKTLEFLRGEYDYVILDCETDLDDLTMSMIEASSRTYIVATPEIGAVRDLSRYVDSLIQHDFTTDKISVVINRFSSRYAVNVEQIEKAIRLPVAIKLPNAYMDLVRAVNLGDPIPPSRKGDFTLQFVRWSASLVGAPQSLPTATTTVKKKDSLFSLWGK
jgi:pilus assembly protein CpaE